jgi:Zn-dependent protease with chaperone function
MHLSVYLPFVFSGLFGAGAPTLARRLPPAVATWLLSLGGLLAAGGSAISLALLGLTLVGQSPLLADRGHWSETALRNADPVATPVAALALLILAVLAVRFAAAAWRRAIALRDAFRLAAAVPAAGGELAVIDHADRQAYAVPGRPGRIVVSRGLLRDLDADQRRALLAHERAHLVHHHHLHHATAHLAAAANPLLRRLPAGVALSTERWADECAAATGRRDTVAEALTRASHRAGELLRVPSAVLAAAATELTRRIQALHSPAPRLTLWRVALLVALLLATAAAVMEAAHDTERLFEFAQAAYRAAHP